MGRSGLNSAFLVRHAYFGVLIAASTFLFASTVGIGRGACERRRRCAIVRAEMDAGRRPVGLLLLAATNVGFFGLTQAVEGVPIASGALAVGLAAALAGSLIAALLVFLFGGSLAVAGLDSVIGRTPRIRAPMRFASRLRPIPAPRQANCAFSLFVPNRPPPAVSSL